MDDRARRPTRSHSHHSPRRQRLERIEARMRTAEQRISRGRLQAGIRDYLAILAEDPDDLRILNRIGDLLVRAEEIDRGIALFLRVGSAYAADGFTAKAIAVFKKILRFDPSRSEARERLAGLYLEVGLAFEPVDCGGRHAVG
ncbi:MAG: hypothetical protein GY856_18680 [bacterium]|nr:hypothetical protein [bacterium]